MRLFPLPFDRAGMNIGNRGTDAGSMLFRCIRFFPVEWKYPTTFFPLFFLFFPSLSLSFVLALGVVSERSIQENASWRRGEKNMARVVRRSNFSLHFFVHQSEGGIANRVECRPLQMRFVGAETRAL